MRLLRTIAVTFAQYSRIPMPHFTWEKEDLRYSMAVFPWVGAVIGLVWLALLRLGKPLGLPEIAMVLLLAAVPVLMTGGFHIDGFMDTEDALSSYHSREEKLRILSDPHIGAFAVIRFALLGLIYLAALDIILVQGALAADSASPYKAALVIAGTFFMSRALSAVSVLYFRPAKENGMLAHESDAAAGALKINRAVCLIEAAACMAWMIFTDPLCGAACVMAELAAFAWYRYKSYKEFGGITGDTAGYFVTIAETAAMAAAAAVMVIR